MREMYRVCILGGYCSEGHPSSRETIPFLYIQEVKEVKEVLSIVAGLQKMIPDLFPPLNV